MDEPLIEDCFFLSAGPNKRILVGVSILEGETPVPGTGCPEPGITTTPFDGVVRLKEDPKTPDGRLARDCWSFEETIGEVQAE